MWENRRDPRSGEYATEISPAVSLEMSWMILYVSFFRYIFVRKNML